MEAEFGLPQWVFGVSSYAFESAERIVCAYARDGVWHLASLDIETGTLEPFDTPYSFVTGVRATPGCAVFIGGSPTDFPAIVQLDATAGRTEVLRRSNTLKIETSYLAHPEAKEFPTENGLTAHALFFPTRNRDYDAPAGGRPPLIVISHGGPTGATFNVLSPALQYWTSRGFAILDVDYGGSTGYGRAYRERLKGQWGVVDVDDGVDGARYLVDQGEVDGARLIIRGGSAGGIPRYAR